MSTNIVSLCQQTLFSLISLLEKPAIYHEKTAVVLKGALHDAGCESGLQGVARMEVEIKRAIKFLQIANDLRQLQRRADVSLYNIRNSLDSIRRKFLE